MVWGAAFENNTLRNSPETGTFWSTTAGLHHSFALGALVRAAAGEILVMPDGSVEGVEVGDPEAIWDFVDWCCGAEGELCCDDSGSFGVGAAGEDCAVGVDNLGFAHELCAGWHRCAREGSQEEPALDDGGVGGV